MRLPLAGTTRATAAVLGWVAAAVVAGLIGITAIGAVGDGIVGSSTTPLSADQVDQQLAARVTTNAGTSTPAASTSASTPAQTSAPLGSSTPPPVTQPPAQGQPKVFSTDGGSVVARCSGASPQIVSATPAQGFTVKKDDQEEGRARVEFESDRQDLQFRVEVACSGNVPFATVEAN